MINDYRFPGVKRLEGRAVVLEKLSVALHGEGLYAACGGPEDQEVVFRYMMFGPFASWEDFIVWLAKQEGLNDRMTYAVQSLRLGGPMGMCSIMNIDTAAGRAEIGSIWYGRAAQRSEINTEAAFLVLDHLFTDLGYRRVEWKCDNGNEASKAAARRLGFVYEGLFRKHMVVKGRNRDTAWFSMIDDEWPEKKRHLEARVDRAYAGL